MLKTNKVLLFFFLIAVLIGVGCGDSSTQTKAKDPHMAAVAQEESIKKAAWSAAQDFTLAQLKAPKSAEFPALDYPAIKKLDAGLYSVISYVDAQNNFGAMLRRQYICKLSTADQGKTWALVDLAFPNYTK